MFILSVTYSDITPDLQAKLLLVMFGVKQIASNGDVERGSGKGWGTTAWDLMCTFGLFPSTDKQQR